MFKLVTGNNGRTVYLGKVARHNDKAVEITGTEYNPEKKAEEARSLQLLYTSDTMGVGKTLGENDSVIVSVMPSRKNPLLGNAEELGKDNSYINITSERGKEKIILVGKVKKKKWNEAHTQLQISFMDLKDVDGKVCGNRYEQTYNGRTTESFWTTINFFKKNDRFPTYYNADNADRDIEVGSNVVIVATKNVNDYNGKTYTNYNANKYVVVG